MKINEKKTEETQQNNENCNSFEKTQGERQKKTQCALFVFITLKCNISY